MTDRRLMMTATAAFAVAGSAGAEGGVAMYGMIARMKAVPAVRDAIRRGRPLIAGFDKSAETTPLGGAGLAKR